MYDSRRKSLNFLFVWVTGCQPAICIMHRNNNSNADSHKPLLLFYSRWLRLEQRHLTNDFMSCHVIVSLLKPPAIEFAAHDQYSHWMKTGVDSFVICQLNDWNCINKTEWHSVNEIVFIICLDRHRKWCVQPTFNSHFLQDHHSAIILLLQ